MRKGTTYQQISTSRAGGGGAGVGMSLPGITSLLGSLSPRIVAKGSAAGLSDFSARMNEAEHITAIDRQKLAAQASHEESQFPLVTISGIKLSAMSAAITRKYAVGDVVYSSGSNRGEIMGSPDDPRFGVLANDVICSTCHRTNMECPGHFGFIDLNHHYLHPLFAIDAVHLLQCFCNTCSALLVTESYIKEQGLDRYHGRTRWKAIAEHCANSKTPCKRPRICEAATHCECQKLGPFKLCASVSHCTCRNLPPGQVCPSPLHCMCRNIPENKLCPAASHCGCRNISPCMTNPTYNASAMKDCYIVTYSYKSKKSKAAPVPVTDEDTAEFCEGSPIPIAKVRTIESILHIFQYVSDKDAALVGFEGGMRPEHLVMQVLPVLPPCARPYSIIDGEKREDQFTPMYREDISKINSEIVLYAGDQYEQRKKIRDLWYKFSHLIDNSDNSMTGRGPSGEPMAGFKQRLSKKEGTIRASSMGKSVNFCARTVLGPCSDARFGYIGVPIVICKGLTIPEGVHSRNIKYITDLYDEGEITHLISGKGAVKGIRNIVSQKVREKYRPMLGDTVDRRLHKNDSVLFNRQPTLSRWSLKGHKVLPIDTKTFGVHMADTGSYNAD
jgi:DNA-directed RNA polymerase beta' subunit